MKREDIQKPFWHLAAEEALRILESGKQGLGEGEVEARKKIFGPNILPEQDVLGWANILLNQLKSPLIFILMMAGSITLFLKEWSDSIVIFAAVIANSFLGFYQESKAENTLALLKTYVKERARVVRAGRESEIDARELVPGDIIRITQGDRVPADARIIFANDLQVDESILTGESLPVIKTTSPVSNDAELADRTPMVFCGTSVVQGFGDAVITATDNDTELGRIALLVKKTEKEKTPLQSSLLSFTMRSSLVLAVLAVALFGFGIYSGKPIYDMFLITVASAVSAVPEGLPIALTVILAIGVQRLAERRGIVRKLLAAETLGSTTIILTDKTGTLTEAKMELKNVLPFENKESEKTKRQLVEYAALNTDVILENPEDSPENWRIVGRALEIALIKSAIRFGVFFPQLKKEIQIVDRLPFNSSNKFSAALIKKGHVLHAVFLGAPEVLLLRSSLKFKEREEILEAVDNLASSGERVVAVAVKEIENINDFRFSKQKEFSHLIFQGIISFRDPVRPGTKEAISRISDAGVRTVILTGDHLGTAEAVAGELGLNIAQNRSIHGAELNELNDKQLKELLPSLMVIARVTPEQKLRIAKAYKEMGEVVAMTGDGVNDAPALKEADIGVAVGSGSDVAKASADLVILDDNFETIVAAIEEGRRVLQNIKKVIIYLLSSAFDELLLIGGALLLGLALPLNALQILWVNLLSESFPAMALAFENNTEDIGREPTKLKERLFDKEMKFFILVIGILTSAFLFAIYALLVRLELDLRMAQTFIFASFGVYSLFLIFSVRNLRTSILKYNIFSNKFLIGGVSVGFVFMALAIYAPPMQKLLDTVPLSPAWLLGVVAVGITNILAIESGKWLFRSKIL